MGRFVLFFLLNDERLFAIGGMAGNPSEASFFAVPYVEMLNLNAKKDDEAWVKLPELPANRTEIAVVFCLGRIYVIGGAGATISSATDSMWSMNVMKTDSKGNSILLSTEEQVKETWRKETPIPTLSCSVWQNLAKNKGFFFVRGNFTPIISKSFLI